MILRASSTSSTARSWSSRRERCDPLEHMEHCASGGDAMKAAAITVAAAVLAAAGSGACTAKYQSAYAKYRFTCTAAKLSKLPAHRSASLLADAFLNAKTSDTTTRSTTFTVGGPPPVLHMTFSSALKGSHTLTVDIHNTTIDAGQSFDTTLQSGWQVAYEV